MGKLKKSGLAGRFGPRYGGRVRQVWREVMERSKGIQKCPKCETKQRNMRLSIGVWQCRRCGAKFTGGAWTAVTTRGKEAQRVALRGEEEEKEATGKKSEVPAVPIP